MSFLSDLFGGGRNRSSETTSSGGLGSISSGLSRAAETARSIPSGIARDVRMGTAAGLFGGRERQAENLANRGFSPAEIQDYFARTDATIARNAAEEAARQNDGPSDAGMAQRVAPVAQQVTPIEDQAPRYRNPFGESALTIMPQTPQVTPEMRREALRIFESQRGAGQVPYQMLPYQQGLGSMRPDVSPAFQYAAQNYARLGGAQRLMDRPMEMMSVAERQRINEMAQAMAGMQRPTPFPGKGAGAQPAQPDVVNRIMPLISQMGIGGLRGFPRAMF